MKKRLKFLLAIGLFSPLLCAAQVNSEYRTINSGLWDGDITWERWKQNPNMAWISDYHGPRWNHPFAKIRSGHIVRLGQRDDNEPYTEMDKSLIETGASLISGAGLDDSIRVLHVYGSADTGICVNGNLGSNNNKEGWISMLSMVGTHNTTNCTTCPQRSHLLGNGSIVVSGLSFSSIAGGYNDTLYIDIDMKITGINNAGPAFGLTTYINNTTNHPADNFRLVLSAGKTITLTDSAYIHMLTNSTTNKSGKMVYIINGTLDASTSIGRTNVIASPVTKTAVTDIEVSGLFKMGKNFNTRSASADSGTLLLNINDGGVVNATAVATPNTNFAARQWMTNGTGVMKRLAGATDTAFAVTTMSTTNNTVLLSTTTPDTFSVAAKPASFVFLGGSAKTEWRIKKSGTGNAAVTATFMWTNADGFSPATGAAVSAYVYTGARWKEYPTTISGTGTLTDPYKAKTTGAIDSIQLAYVGISGQTMPPSPVGIKNVNVSTKAVSVAPNPVSNGVLSVTMDGVAAGKYKISVYSITGQTVYSAEVNHISGAHSIVLPSAVTSGVYQLSVSGNGFRAVEKVVVE